MPAIHPESTKATQAPDIPEEPDKPSIATQTSSNPDPSALTSETSGPRVVAEAPSKRGPCCGIFDWCIKHKSDLLRIRIWTIVFQIWALAIFIGSLVLIFTEISSSEIELGCTKNVTFPPNMTEVCSAGPRVALYISALSFITAASLLWISTCCKRLKDAARIRLTRAFKWLIVIHFVLYVVFFAYREACNLAEKTTFIHIIDITSSFVYGFILIIQLFFLFMSFVIAQAHIFCINNHNYDV